MKKLIFVVVLLGVSFCQGADDEGPTIDPIDAYGRLEAIPKAAKVAYVLFRKITDIPKGLDYPELEELDLSHNQIIEIDPGVLKNLPKLRKLTLNYNPIKGGVIAKLKAVYPDLEIDAEFTGEPYRDQKIAPYRIKAARNK